MNNTICANDDHLPTRERNNGMIKDQFEIDDKGLLDGKTDSRLQHITSSLMIDTESKHKSDAECKPPTGCCPSQLLPADFKPSPYSVVIGRGKASTEAVGNRRLSVLAKTFLPTYAKTTSKNDKTLMVTRLVEIVQDACPRGGAFVKLSGGRWWEVDGHTAREKVGYVLRELLHDKYRSSSKSKVEKRRQQREVKRAELIASKKKEAEQINPAYLADIDSTRKCREMIQSSFQNLMAGSLSSLSPSSSIVDEMRICFPKDTEVSTSVAINGLKSYTQPTSGGPARRLLQKQLSADCIPNLYAKDCTGQSTGAPPDRLFQKQLSEDSISFRDLKDLRIQTPWDLLSPHGSSGTNSTFHDVQSVRELNTSSNKLTNTPASSSSSSLKPRSLVDAWSHTWNNQETFGTGNQDRLGCDDEDDISKIFE